jgi:tetratricopeptide (TPR) repeat protein
MPSPFLSSEEYDERAHQLYNEGQYDEALEVLREGLTLYPNSVELQIGVGYARLAREEYAWARQSFEKALVLDPDHEDALAGLGETLLKFGLQEQAVRTFRRVLELGYEDDIDLMLQAGRALFREGLIEEAKQFFEIAAREAPDMAEAAALVGYAHHRLGDDASAIAQLERALKLDDEHVEARIYLANILYDRGEYEPSLHHLEKKSFYRLRDDDPDLQPWDTRLGELSGEPDDVDQLLAEVEESFAQRLQREEEAARNQLELFGGLLSDLSARKLQIDEEHRITVEEREFIGTWDDIVRQMRDANKAFVGRSLQEFMANEARRVYSVTGVKIPTRDAESFIRGSANAGLLKIVR